MNTSVIKKSVLTAFNEILSDLSVKELEDLQDKISVKLFKLTDDGERISIDEVRKKLNLAKN